MQIKIHKKRLLTVLLTLCMVLILLPLSVFASEINYISSVGVNYSKFSYNAGETPLVSAYVTEGNCIVAYEYWREIYQPEEGGVWTGTGRYWYSDSEKMAALSEDKRITQFEAGHTYSYNIVLESYTGSFFSDEKTLVTVGHYDWGLAGHNTNLAIKEMSTELHIYSIYSITFPEESTTTAITTADIEDVKLDYQPGDTPQITARRAGVNPDQYDIIYECWEKRETDDYNTVRTVAYWYSDDKNYSEGDSRFDTFERGGRYRYSIKLKAKDGYVFDSSLSRGDVFLNGKTLPYDSYILVMDNGNTCLITYGTETYPYEIIEAIRLDAIISFSAGEKPRFSTGDAGPYIVTEHQRWNIKDVGGYGVSSDESLNEGFDRNGKLITEFKDGTTYTYGLYFRLSSLGKKEGYRFGENTKLYINGNEIPLTQITVDISGTTFWLSNVLYMTPTPTSVELQKIDEVEIEGATVSFKDGDKPVFTGKVPQNASYIYQSEGWENKDGAGVNSDELLDEAYEKHIDTFKSSEAYQYLLCLKAGTGYYFTADTKIKINGSLYNYTLASYDTDYDSTGKIYTLRARTDLTMTPLAPDVKPEYKVTEGENGSWTQSSDGTLKFVANGDFAKFTGVKVDGILIDADKYTAVSGSTVITLKKDFLSTLSVDKHTLTVVYKDGECSTEFIIKANQNGGETQPGVKETEEEEEEQEEQENLNSPLTGDNSNPALWLTLLLISGGAVIGIMIAGRKEKTE